jgi:hypothetical protein
MNAKRKLAFFTACNIDGKTAKDIDRKTGVVTSYTPGATAKRSHRPPKRARSGGTMIALTTTTSRARTCTRARRCQEARRVRRRG